MRQELFVGFGSLLVLRAGRGPQEALDPLGLAARAAQPVDLVLLAHDQVLHQVLERLGARLLAGVAG